MYHMKVTLELYQCYEAHIYADLNLDDSRLSVSCDSLLQDEY